MKTIVRIMKKLIFSIVVLYSFNIIMNSLHIFIPINIYTIITVSLFGFPGLFLLIGLTTIL